MRLSALESPTESEAPMSHCSLETSVPEWVIDHPETLAVFQNLGIDYCCGGKSLEFACQEQGLNKHEVLRMLSKLIAERDS